MVVDISSAVGIEEPEKTATLIHRVNEALVDQALGKLVEAQEPVT